MKTEIVVKFQLEGIHAWPKCPHDEVAFLRNEHRHMFHITVWKKVSHEDREIEIIMCRRGLLEAFPFFKAVDSDVRNFGDWSCEKIASELLVLYGLDAVEVLEDGENGARVSR